MLYHNHGYKYNGLNLHVAVKHERGRKYGTNKKELENNDGHTGSYNYSISSQHNKCASQQIEARS